MNFARCCISMEVMRKIHPLLGLNRLKMAAQKEKAALCDYLSGFISGARPDENYRDGHEQLFAVCDGEIVVSL